MSLPVAVQVVKELCPHCGIKLPVSLPMGQIAWVWCRSKGCGGRWVLIDKRTVVLQ